MIEKQQNQKHRHSCSIDQMAGVTIETYW